ncbi:hypothetical protein [Geminisphaera colitermitum]|uniref:hypothetical protein n=1 Tax=Geminisphaera colitermitum TaxID=1148786 RepID=UPI000158C95D|nr:hypothetical protein [Geminisphaera colitermitum]
MKPSRPQKTVNAEHVLPVRWRESFLPDFPRIGLGLDLGTTTKKKSNPSVLAVNQQVSLTHVMRLIVRWKTDNPAVTRSIVETVVRGLPHGLRARRLCIDATSERFFASDLRSQLAGIVPVSLVISSETTSYGGESMLFKSYLGNLFVNTIEDGYVALPPDDWVKTSIRLVTRDRGTFDTDVAEDGDHGDVFDAIKLSIHAVTAKGGPITAHAAQVGAFQAAARPPRNGIRNPYAPENLRARRAQHRHSL